jgi:pimeloyl-ACP methyl ester carboxylesterase
LLNYFERGTGFPVVLVHGFTDQSMSWFLADSNLLAGFRVIAVDLPGHGRSAPWEGERITMHEMAEELHKVVLELGVEKFAIIGHSMGGMVAQQYCVEWPENLTSLFLCCTAARGELLADTAFNLDAVREQIQKEGIVKAASADPYSAFAPGYDSPLVRKYLELEFVTDGPTALKCLDAIMAFRLDKVLAKDYRGQTVIICGDADRITPERFAPEMAESFAGSKVATIHGAGHMVFLERPKEFDALVRDHLSKKP